MPAPPAPPEPPSESLSFWDLAYQHADHLEHWEPLETPTELVDALDEGLIGPGRTALDVGCGAGAEAVFLAQQGITTLGVDASSVALELARRRADDAGVTVDWRRGDVSGLPITDRSIDLALDRGCLHVIGRRRRRLYARELTRVLRLGGSLLLRGARSDDEELGLVGISRRDIDRLFVSRGFECRDFTRFSMRARAGEVEAVRVLLTLNPS